MIRVLNVSPRRRKKEMLRSRIISRLKLTPGLIVKGKTTPTSGLPREAGPPSPSKWTVGDFTRCKLVSIVNMKGGRKNLNIKAKDFKRKSALFGMLDERGLIDLESWTGRSLREKILMRQHLEANLSAMLATVLRRSQPQYDDLDSRYRSYEYQKGVRLRRSKKPFRVRQVT